MLALELIGLSKVCNVCILDINMPAYRVYDCYNDWNTFLREYRAVHRFSKLLKVYIGL